MAGTEMIELPDLYYEGYDVHGFDKDNSNALVLVADDPA